MIFADTQNPSWDYTGVSNWSVVEINVGIICTCMPALRVILVRLFPLLGGSTKATNQYYLHSGSLTAGKSKGRSRAGTGGQLQSNISYPEPAKKSKQSKNGIIYQQRTYTVQYSGEDSDEHSLVHMQDLDFKSNDGRKTGDVST